MQTYQDAAGAWVAVLNGRVSGGHVAEADAKQAVIGAEINALGTTDANGDYVAPGVETVRAWAIAYVRSIAAEKEDGTDALVIGNPVRAMMINTEIVQYQNDGRPANPSAAVYALADALATRRGATLRDTLEALRTRWLSVRSRIATIITELDRVEDAIKAAATVGEIEAVLAGLNYG